MSLAVYETLYGEKDSSLESQAIVNCITIMLQQIQPVVQQFLPNTSLQLFFNSLNHQTKLRVIFYLQR